MSEWEGDTRFSFLKLNKKNGIPPQNAVFLIFILHLTAWAVLHHFMNNRNVHIKDLIDVIRPVPDTYAAGIWTGYAQKGLV